MKQFEVWTVKLNPTKGAEINKTRPCLIISPDSMNTMLNTIIVAPLTHSIKNYPSRVDCNFKAQAGQVVLDQIRTVDKMRLIKKIGSMDAKTNMNVCTILQVMFQFNPL
ncbi:MAG: type II toxin-antitoxin system PemK/MazF family toxin [Chitinophagaceae bacterium]|nr:type II toxin-antitoxin system PemK/MazF family toxin [Chitinophagaceae bacterium]